MSLNKRSCNCDACYDYLVLRWHHFCQFRVEFMEAESTTSSVRRARACYSIILDTPVRYDCRHYKVDMDTGVLVECAYDILRTAECRCFLCCMFACCCTTTTKAAVSMLLTQLYSEYYCTSFKFQVHVPVSTVLEYEVHLPGTVFEYSFR